MLNKISLLNTLCSVINSSHSSGLDCVLAKHFLKNIDHLSDLNVYDVAENCFCTRQSVSRFCVKIGFANFTEMKNYYNLYDYQKWEYLNRLQVDDFRFDLINEINNMMNEINACFENRNIKEITNSLHESSSITVLIDSASISMVTFFQRAMIFCGKIVQILTNAYGDNSILENMYQYNEKKRNPILKSLNKNDLLITISVTGNFAKATNDMVKKCKAKKIIVTLNHDNLFRESYEEIVYLSEADKSHEGVNVYTVYGVNYFLDILFDCYYQEYGEKKLVDD